MNHPPRTDRQARVLIGTHTYLASGGAVHRQQEAVQALLALRGAEIVNVQFAHQPHDVAEVRTLAMLRQSSNSVSGRRGPSKAIVSEILDVLAAEASARSMDYICFTNADIIFTQQAVDWIAGSGREAYLFSREDFDGETRAPIQMEIAGVDVVAVATSWWLANRRRFRRYIAGEACWDNVYTAIVMCHADALIENRRALVRHERHPMGPMPSPYFGQYVRMLTALEEAKRGGTSIVAINPLPEAGLIRFKNPQRPSGIVGRGTQIADQFLQRRLGGDMAPLGPYLPFGGRPRVWLASVSRDCADGAVCPGTTDGLCRPGRR